MTDWGVTAGREEAGVGRVVRKETNVVMEAGALKKRESTKAAASVSGFQLDKIKLDYVAGRRLTSDQCNREQEGHARW